VGELMSIPPTGYQAFPTISEAHDQLAMPTGHG